MLLSELATVASGMDEAAFLEAHPQPALLFLAQGARVGDSDDATLHGENLWAGTSAGSRAPVPPAILTPDQPVEAGADRTPLVAFLKKSKRNPFSGVIVLGRQPRADVVVASAAISKVHLVFAEAPSGGWTVLDQQSLNGTTLNAVPLEKGQAQRIHDGDALVIGGAIEATFCEPRSVFCLVEAWRRGEPLGAHGWVRVATPREGIRLPPKSSS